MTQTSEHISPLRQRMVDDMRVSRMTLVMATMPFKELLEKIENNREFAVAAGATFKAIDPNMYQAIADSVFDARRRVMAALANRVDMEEILEESK